MSAGTQDVTDVALAVVAGGEGSRMGAPKVELRLDGKPILQVLLDHFRWPGPTVLSVAPHHRRAAGAERFDRVVVDQRPGEGPLRGLHDVLVDSPASYVVVTAVDMPRVTRDQLVWLASALKARPEASGLMIRRTGPSGTSHVEPFPCAFHTRFAPSILPRLVPANRALHPLADAPAVLSV